jgi:DNA mismatch repair protein MSH4
MLTPTQNCAPINIVAVLSKIDEVINGDVKYSKNPLDLRYQRTFAVKSGQDGFLDVSRTTFKENTNDAYDYAERLGEELEMKIELKFDPVRQFYLRFNSSELNDRILPPVLTNVIKKKEWIECLTLDLAKRNQKAGNFEHVPGTYAYHL